MVPPECTELTTPAALALCVRLHREFEGRRQELLAKRRERQAEIDTGAMPDFLAGTRAIREGSWRVAPLPADLQDRRVEITGPTDRKMVINALNSGAKVFMADFEDATAPTWDNLIRGQRNLYDAVRRRITFESPEGKSYRLNERPATLLVRPRGWHLPEKHLCVDGMPIAGAFFDFGLYFFHNARELLRRGTGPYFYLPKLQHHEEARLWNDVFQCAQDEVGIPRGTIKATVLIEHILAAFQCEEILYELRDHAAGLNCGRWDYIFSFIKTFRRHRRFVLPDRAQVTMTAPFLRAYTLNVIRACHRRGAHAMGGMAAQIPIRQDARANAEAMAKVRADKEREASDGHDGTWVAHPGLVPVAQEVFDRLMPQAHQVARLREDVRTTAADLLAVPEGTITEGGARTNVRVGVQYLEAWLRGNGCVPLNHLMEDAATAEISRTQIWQWIHHAAALEDGRTMTGELLRRLRDEELAAIRQDVGTSAYASGRYSEAARIFEELSTSKELADFLTLPAYEYID